MQINDQHIESEPIGMNECYAMDKVYFAIFANKNKILTSNSQRGCKITLYS